MIFSSSIIQKIKQAALDATPTHSEAYAAWRAEYEAFHADGGGRDKLGEAQSAAAFTAGLGVAGIFGLAMANVSAASMAAGMSVGPVAAAMASTSTALAALGAVTIAGAALPVATVATLGVAVAGTAALVVSSIAKKIKQGSLSSKGEDLRWHARMDGDGKDSPGGRAILAGLKGVIADQVRSAFAPKRNPMLAPKLTSEACGVRPSNNSVEVATVNPWNVPAVSGVAKDEKGVKYFVNNGDRPAFTESADGRSVSMNSQKRDFLLGYSDDAIESMLLVAQEKYGEVELVGDDDFMRQATEVAERCGITLSNPAELNAAPAPR